MYKHVLIFAALLVALMLWWRASLYDKPHIASIDTLGVRGSVLGVLPPSGYRPGHLLRDTLKNDKQHSPPSMTVGRYAYRQYLSADAASRRRVESNLAARLLPAERWVESVSRRKLDFLCVGESHEQSYRRFLAASFFPYYELDILYLEARLLPAKVMHVRADLVGEEEVELLDADIAAIIRAVKLRNPAVRIVGIEESRGQLSARRASSSGSRDQSMFDNVTASYEAGRRSAALLGALHCTRRSSWLYARLESARGQHAFGSLLNMRLTSESKDLLSRELFRFLRLMGYTESAYAITDTETLEPQVHEWFLDLTRNLARYQTVILFQDAAGEVAAGG